MKTCYYEAYNNTMNIWHLLRYIYFSNVVLIRKDISYTYIIVIDEIVQVYCHLN